MYHPRKWCEILLLNAVDKTAREWLVKPLLKQKYFLQGALHLYWFSSSLKSASKFSIDLTNMGSHTMKIPCFVRSVLCFQCSSYIYTVAWCNFNGKAACLNKPTGLNPVSRKKATNTHRALTPPVFVLPKSITANMYTLCLLHNETVKVHV